MTRQLKLAIITLFVALPVFLLAQGWRGSVNDQSVFYGTTARPNVDSTNLGSATYRWNVFAKALTLSTGVMSAPTSADCTAPPYTFTGRTTTGMASTAAAAWDLCAGGVSVLGWASNIASFRSGVTGQSIYVYNTYTDASNYERGVMSWGANTFVVGTKAAGTGSLRTLTLDGGNVNVATNGGSTWQFTNATGNLVPVGTDNAQDIGIVSTNRVHTGFFGTSVVSPLFASDTAKILLKGTGSGAGQLAVGQTTPPTCSSNCGTSPAILGSDSSMTVTMGSSGVPASGWVVSFAGTWAAAPSCMVQMAKAGMVAGKQALTAVASTTILTVVTNGTAPGTSDVYNILCTGIQ